MSRTGEIQLSAITGELLRNAGASGPVLVVGCGDGREAGHLARLLNARVVGIDIGGEFQFDYGAAFPAELQTMDARQLGFKDDTFDTIYSFHALEHIPDPVQAMREMRRVLRPGGTFLIGTPNKSRIIGYIGSASPVSDRIRWNLADWRARLTRRWSNELGAHAGFTAAELASMCSAALGETRDVSDEYYLKLYPGKRRLLRVIVRTGVRRWAYPAVYVVGHNRKKVRSPSG